MLETVVADVNGSGIPVVPIDLPSGLSADTHELIGEAIEAAVTVTLGAPKLPLVLPPAEVQAGDIVIADIGIPDEVIDALDGPRVELLTRAQHAASSCSRAPPTRTRATTGACSSSPARWARAARRTCRRWARCDRAPGW